ncbi:MAG: YggS family pyridoxal phosphate-dependent enzyme [Holosporaceae bacterium]|jgi:pyridoxal phosphate enzyme (YggS family)|nr:YggS family pyridoxal phosphate-dependent enzyme [Rhodospirillaceae bacterium]
MTTTDTAAILARYGQLTQAMADYPNARLIVVSKHQPPEALVPLLQAGQRDFGENRVQEAASKWPALHARFPDLRLHLIGQLQRNKVAEAAKLFDAIHSLDRPALADALAAVGYSRPLLIQVNLAAEPQKGGVLVADLPALITHSRDRLGLKLVGLMTIPPQDEDAAPYFHQLAALARQHQLPDLSMGMSEDYPQALAAGASLIRVGSYLFSPSKPPV